MSNIQAARRRTWALHASLRAGLTGATIAATIALAACGGGGDDDDAPRNGVVRFQHGANCPSPMQVAFFIDGTNVGNETLSFPAGLFSREYPATAGNHTVGATAAAAGLTWPAVTRSVPSGGSFTLVLDCPRQ